MYTIYSKKECPFCVKAKEALGLCDIEYVEVDIEVIPEAKEMLAREGLKTVPQVYHGEYRIGGYEDLADYLLENDLTR